MNLKNVGSATLSLCLIAFLSFSPTCYAQDEYPELVREGMKWYKFWVDYPMLCVYVAVGLAIFAFRQKLWKFFLATLQKIRARRAQKETQPPTAAPTPEPRLTRLDKEGEPTPAPALPTPPNFNQLKLPMFANLEKLNSVDFHIWQAVDRSRNQVITIERNTLSAAKALKAFSPGYSPFHNPDPMFNELSDADDVVTIDWQRLQYKPIVIDRALTRLCDAGVLERGEWQGGMRVYPLLIPYDNPAEPSV